MKDNSGKITIDELRNICEQMKLPVEEGYLDALISYCDIDGDKQIDYEEFVNFLNWDGLWKDDLKHSQLVSSEVRLHVLDLSQRQHAVFASQRGDPGSHKNGVQYASGL